MKDGNIVISPFNEKCLSNCSYDVTLGENYYRCVTDSIFPINPWSVGDSDSYWGKCQIADIAGKDYSMYGLNPSEKYIILNPGETILGHTNEFIGGKNFIVASMKGRSSIGRMNISVCHDCGWRDIGYINRWTMTIQNLGKSSTDWCENCSNCFS